MVEARSGHMLGDRADVEDSFTASREMSSTRLANAFPFPVVIIHFRCRNLVSHGEMKAVFVLREGNELAQNAGEDERVRGETPELVIPHCQ